MGGGYGGWSGCMEYLEKTMSNKQKRQSARLGRGQARANRNARSTAEFANFHKNAPTFEDLLTLAGGLSTPPRPTIKVLPPSADRRDVLVLINSDRHVALVKSLPPNLVAAWDMTYTQGVKTLCVHVGSQLTLTESERREVMIAIDTEIDKAVHFRRVTDSGQELSPLTADSPPSNPENERR